MIPARLLVANLDCEASWTAAMRPGVARSALRATALARAADAGAWLAGFARPGDRLWLPALPGPAAARIATELGALVELGPLAAVAPAAAVLAWGETDEVARLRVGPPAPAAGPALHQRVWAIAPPTPAIAARAADRRLAAEVADRLGVALPGARSIASVAELEHHLAAGGARAGDGAFVLKAPWSAAGRDRVVHRGALDRATAIRVDRLLARFGALLFEPWLDRVADLGCGGLIDTGGVTLFPPHRTEVDARGVFRAASIDDVGSWLATGERDALARAATAAGDALAAAGYRGPFAIDGFRHRTPTGTALHPLCEINARLSFGLVARALAERAPPAPGVTL